MEKINYNQIEFFAKGKELPRIIDTPYPYVVISDLSCVIDRISPNLEGKATELQVELNSILKDVMPTGSTFYETSPDDFGLRIKNIIYQEINRSENNTGIINLDRYLCENMQNNLIYPINVSRGIDGGLVSRPGESESPEKQLQSLTKWCSANKFKKIIIIDDVLAFGDTLVPLINNLKNSLANTDITVLVGLASSGEAWSGIETVQEKTGISPQFVTMIKASPQTSFSSGMAIPTSRDFTFLGGKIASTEKGKLSFPYFLPFSEPVISFMPTDKRIDCARNLLTFNKKLSNVIGMSLGRSLKISDLINAGFGVPYTRIDNLAKIMECPHQGHIYE